MTAPRVSVVVPTRNRRALLAEALGGVDGQTFADLELIVVDDASTDGTCEWLHARGGARVVACPEPVGAAAARNRGLAVARGELVAFLDDDDRWDASYLAAQVANLASHPGALFSYAGHVERDGRGRRRRPDLRTLLPEAGPLVRLLAESYIHTLSVVVCRRRAFLRHGGFDEGLRIVHDLDWYARLLAAGETAVPLGRTLVERRVPGGLVTEHRPWCAEERTVLDRALVEPSLRGCRRAVLASRALFFARLSLGRGDVAFGLARLAEAFATSPSWTARLTARGLLRRARTGAQGPGSARLPVEAVP